MKSVEKFLKPQYGTNLNSYDLAKIIAVATMIIDHVGAFFPDVQWLRVLGRVAFPTFIFLVGYSSSFKIKPSLIFWAFLVQVTLWFSLHQTFLNILFTVIICRLALKVFVKFKMLERSQEIAIVYVSMLLFYPATMLLFEYGSLAVCVALFGYLLRQEGKTPRVFLLAVAAAITAFLGNQNSLHLHYYQSGVFAGLIILLFLFFINFHLYKINIKNILVKNLGLFFSRYSMEIYALHYSGFLVFRAFF